MLGELVMRRGGTVKVGVRGGTPTKFILKSILCEDDTHTLTVGGPAKGGWSIAKDDR